MTTMRWRPIAECPPDLETAVVFDPSHVWMVHGTLYDERVRLAARSEDGKWCYDTYDGGDCLEPTHFLDPGVPEGFPRTINSEPFRIAAEAERAEQEERRRRREAEAARTARETAEITPERERELQAQREAYWSDPANWHRPPDEP